MSMNWGNDPDSPRRPPQKEPKRDGSALFFAALGISLIYALVLGGGTWLRSFAKHRPTTTQANPMPVPVQKAE